HKSNSPASRDIDCPYSSREVKEEDISDDEDYEEKEKGEEKEKEPPAKKRNIGKSERRSRISNGPTREMECPKCTNYRFTSVVTIIQHLKYFHGTTPSDAGLMFLCDCGHKSASNAHLNSQCKFLNFTIIHEKKEGVKCILCENGIHIVCSCGAKIKSNKGSWTHKKICNRREFTVEKNDEE
ncbi:hypothetical protein PFISCL1PPCAC_21770, partial [Pristionchus fissidentatus]